MKKQNKKEESCLVRVFDDYIGLPISLRILVITIAISSVFIMMYSLNNIYEQAHPKYNITKTECWNETKSEDLEIYLILCPEYFIKPNIVDCLDKNGNKIIGVSCEEKPSIYECSKFKDNNFSEYLLVKSFHENEIITQVYNSKTFELHPEYAMVESYGHLINELPKKNIVYQHCESKEVDGMFIDKSKQDGYYWYVDYITKEQIDEMVLLDNCECINWCNKDGCGEGLWYADGKCSKYKCGTYQVEVLK